jgi:hypothetical protein
VIGVYARAATWYCKYIRRELRNLFDGDRAAFFEAASVLYKIPESVGKLQYVRRCINGNNLTAGLQKFGSNYVSMDRLIYMHNNLAGARSNLFTY